MTRRPSGFHTDYWLLAANYFFYAARAAAALALHARAARLLRLRGRAAQPRAPDVCGLHRLPRAVDDQRHSDVGLRRRAHTRGVVGRDELRAGAAAPAGLRRLRVGLPRERGG